MLNGKSNSNPLMEVITGLGSQLYLLREQLIAAHCEIARLRESLNKKATAAIDVGSLRRKVAYYCHPDRGGNLVVMQQVNTLFDCLEG